MGAGVWVPPAHWESDVSGRQISETGHRVNLRCRLPRRRKEQLNYLVLGAWNTQAADQPLTASYLTPSEDSQ